MHRYYRWLKRRLLDQRRSSSLRVSPTSVRPDSALAAPRPSPTFASTSNPERVPSLPDGTSLADAQLLLDACEFHHGINFGCGLMSNSPARVDATDQVAEALFGALSLSGRSVLDVGTWTGAYSFEAKRRGAFRVVASDHYVWNHPAFEGRKAFDLAHKLSGLAVEPVDIDIPDVSSATMGKFDVVLFAGVFYHLKDPILATQQISSCAEHVLILETHLDALDNPRPSMIFYPGCELNGDGSNWWGPNPQCIYDLLTSFGFEDIWYCDAPGETDRGVFHAFRSESSRQLLGWKGAGPWLSLRNQANRSLVFAPTASRI